jgi:hypothetical protein
MEGTLGNEADPWVWWRSNFQKSWRVSGPPLLFGSPNLDFLAGALGELPLGLIFSKEEVGFFYKEFALDGVYVPTPSGRVESLARKVVLDSLRNGPRSFQKAQEQLYGAARGVRERAEVILAVEDGFFRGEGGERRFINGEIVEPLEKPSVAMFAETKVARKRGAMLPTGEAYSKYFDFCRMSGLEPVKKTVFRERFATEVRRRWGQGVRNDLKVDGSSHQGWSELAIL